EWLLDNRDRRTLAHRRRIRSPTQALDRRTHLCLAQPFPATGTRFRALRQNRRRLHPPRHDPHHAQAPRCKLLVMNRNFADGLLLELVLLELGVTIRALAALSAAFFLIFLHFGPQPPSPLSSSISWLSSCCL